MTLRGLALGALALAASACQLGEQADRSEERAYVQLVRDDTLATLAKADPAARKRLERAPGYGVFSSYGSQLFGAGTGRGFGIVHDNRSGAETYMRMTDLPALSGGEPRRFRAVFVFQDGATMEQFAVQGWDFADPVPPAGISVFQFVDGALEATPDIAKTRYAKDWELTGDR